MLTLSLETSSSRGSVAIHRDGRNLCSRDWTRANSHSELVTSAISECLEHAGLDISEIDTLAVGRGPGSFTGIRVAINAIRALAYVSNLPIYAFDSAEIIAAAVSSRGLPLLVLTNAQRASVFASVFEFDSTENEWSRLQDFGLLSLSELEARITHTHLCVGDGYAAISPLISQGLTSRLERDDSLGDEPLADSLGRLAWNRRHSVETIGWNALNPLYVRASGAEETLRKGE